MALLNIYNGELKEKSLIAGDLHGDIDSLNKIIGLYENNLISSAFFLGDYSDKAQRCKNGSFNDNVLIFDILMDFKKSAGNDAVFLKGNHESFDSFGNPTFNSCDLFENFYSKKSWMDYFSKISHGFLDGLFDIAIVKYDDYKIVLVHGGLSDKIKGMDSLANADIYLAKELLWNDPKKGNGVSRNSRGSHVKYFGKDVTVNALKSLDSSFLIRGHEPKKAKKIPWEFHDWLGVTISSTTAYKGVPHALIAENGSLVCINLDNGKLMDYSKKIS